MLVVCIFVHLQGNMEAIHILYKQIGDLGLRPNFLTFAVLLHCHGRQEILAVDAVEKVLKQVIDAVSPFVFLCCFSI